jgi:hypothetical protein
MLLAGFDTLKRPGFDWLHDWIPAAMARLALRHPQAAYRVLRTITQKILLRLPVLVLSILACRWQ